MLRGNKSGISNDKGVAGWNLKTMLAMGDVNGLQRFSLLYQPIFLYFYDLCKDMWYIKEQSFVKIWKIQYNLLRDIFSLTTGGAIFYVKEGTMK